MRDVKHADSMMNQNAERHVWEVLSYIHDALFFVIM